MVARILVVEDDPLNRKLVSLILHRAGYAVELAADATEAERRLAEATPDLILMDLDLPGKDGLTLAHELRGRTQTEATPILAITGYPLQWNEGSSRSAGCNDYITKPFSDTDLRARIAHWLDLSLRGLTPH